MPKNKRRAPAVEMRTPLRTWSMGPFQGPYAEKARCMSPLPRVRVAKMVRKPIRPRDGHSNTSFCFPSVCGQVQAERAVLEPTREPPQASCVTHLQRDHFDQLGPA